MAERLTHENLQYVSAGGDSSARLTEENLQYVSAGGASSARLTEENIQFVYQADSRVRLTMGFAQYVYYVTAPTSFIPQTAVIG